MTADPNVRPLTPGELLYRRIPVKPAYYDAVTNRVQELAFTPIEGDVDGLSLSRQVVGPAGAAALGRVGGSFYVAALLASDLTDKLGLNVVADRDDHALITELTYARRKSKDPFARQQLVSIYGRLVKSVLAVTGPYPGQFGAVTRR